jgi:hypothetical protein
MHLRPHSSTPDPKRRRCPTLAVITLTDQEIDARIHRMRDHEVADLWCDVPSGSRRCRSRRYRPLAPGRWPDPGSLPPGAWGSGSARKGQGDAD